MNLEDTLVVEFGGNADSVDHIAFAELDDVLNGEQTSFGPGDVVNVLLHFSNNIQFDEVVVTDGSVKANGSDSRTTSSEVLFSGRVEPTEHTASVVPSSSSLEFYGRVGSPTVETDEKGIVTFTGNDIVAVPYLTSLTHNYTCLLFKVTLPDVLVTEDSDWPVAVVFYVSEKP